MGERAKKKRAADARAARIAKKTADALAVQPTEGPSSESAEPTGTSSQAGNSSGNKLPTQSSSKKKSVAHRVASSTASTSHTRRSTRSLVVSSTRAPSSYKKKKSAEDHSDDKKATRPERSATVAARALLEQLQYAETEDTDIEEDPEEGDGDSDGNGNGNGNGNNSSDSNGNGDDDDDDDGSEIEVVEVGNLKMKQRLVAPAKATRKKLPGAPAKATHKEPPSANEEEPSSDEDGESESTVELNRALEIELLIDIFEMTLEINDNARRARRNLTLSSSTSWDNLKDRVAEVLNIHQGSLQLQYRFSNEKNNALPFDLCSHQDYDEMRDQLKPLILPKILASGEVSKRVRKVVVVQLFNRGMEGARGKKGTKVSDQYSILKLSYLSVYTF